MVREWGQIGQAVGVGVISAAKELGVAANEFAKTDLGKITVAILIYKYMGKELIDQTSRVFNTVIRMCVLVFGIMTAWFFYRKAVYTKTVVYTPRPILWGSWTWMKKTVTYARHTRGDGTIRSLSDSEQLLAAGGPILLIMSIVYFIFGR
jgi:hypothetical protein